MSQLIALIIAIALGAIVTAIGYVFLGDAFTSNSERGVALQMVNQGSQVEMSMTAFRAENAASVVNATSAPQTDLRADYLSVAGDLVTAEFLKDIPVSPVADPADATTLYNLVVSGNDTFLVIDSALLSANVCSEIEELAGRDETLEVAADATAAIAALGTSNSRYGCFDSTAGQIFVYGVE